MEYGTLHVLTRSIHPETKRPTQTLLLLYEFEALTKLGDTKAESVLERALVLPNPEPRLFESFAGKLITIYDEHRPKKSKKKRKRTKKHARIAVCYLLYNYPSVQMQ